jgi:hypothetical protein
MIDLASYHPQTDKILTPFVNYIFSQNPTVLKNILGIGFWLVFISNFLKMILLPIN